MHELDSFDTDLDRGWPLQRLRIGWSLVLFFLFETQIAQKLPLLIPYLALGAGLALLGSGLYSIRGFRQVARIAAIQRALDHYRSEQRLV